MPVYALVEVCGHNVSRTTYISTSFVKSEDQFANVFAKTLCQSIIKVICFKLGLYEIYAPA